MQEELASIIFAPKLIVTNNRKLNWYDKDNRSKAQERRVFRLSESETAPVWIRGEYVRSEKKYSCTKFDDINHENWFKGSREVFIDFEF